MARGRGACHRTGGMAGRTAGGDTLSDGAAEQVGEMQCRFPGSGGVQCGTFSRAVKRSTFRSGNAACLSSAVECSAVGGCAYCTEGRPVELLRRLRILAVLSYFRILFCRYLHSARLTRCCSAARSRGQHWRWAGGEGSNVTSLFVARAPLPLAGHRDAACVTRLPLPARPSSRGRLTVTPRAGTALRPAAKARLANLPFPRAHTAPFCVFVLLVICRLVR